jgi:hypothetical protein
MAEVDNDWLVRMYHWKEKAKWSIRHENTEDGLARVLQEGVNLGHELDEMGVWVNANLHV